MAQSTTQFLKVREKSGKIEVGKDADLVVWDPDQSFTVNEAQIFHKHKVTPYLGKTLKGVVKTTFVRGQKVYESGKFNGPLGKEVERQ
jgi:allantoinase